MMETTVGSNCCIQYWQTLAVERYEPLLICECYCCMRVYNPAEKFLFYYDLVKDGFLLTSSNPQTQHIPALVTMDSSHQLEDEFLEEKAYPLL
ncbi:melanocortin receptor 5 isoform X2 [Engystomops pustulosus]|uniref:melanocortin receptor 5 isoform X2 n=1 Tax=Engystomops pustulosus TaxID=76066 RepID=UPI003AFB6DF9